MNLKLENPFECRCLITVRIGDGVVLFNQYVEAGQDIRLTDNIVDPNIRVDYAAIDLHPTPRS